MLDLEELVRVLGPVGACVVVAVVVVVVGYKKTGYRVKPRFATVGFARNVEKKYHDKTYQANHNEVQTGGPAGAKSSGITYISNTWGTSCCTCCETFKHIITCCSTQTSS